METLTDEQVRQSEITMMRFRDPQRGPFDPVGQQPMVRRIDKTRQDRMPVDQRPRVQEAQRRASKMKGAS